MYHQPMPEIPAEYPKPETSNGKSLEERLSLAEQKIAEQERQIADLKRQLAESQAQRAIAENLSMTDTLTGLPNRRYVEAQLAQELAIIERNSAFDLGILFIDLDNFKGVNDTYDHTQGDKVLKDLAREMGIEVRDSDLFGRYAGDEFIIILHLNPETDDDSSVEIANRFIKAANRVNRSNKPNEFIPQGISVGFARIRCLNDIDPETAINAADNLAANAKARGKNCVSYSIVDEYGNTELRSTSGD